ncbi:GntR family transcriptional regulator [Kitasatospora sp. NPDC086801]|uniref:GntR family transcriptional regulator n=1 Tax=Kitasatospora sp. NPDC086801 TaxID=3364066 RepID=UPI0037F96415
MSNSPRRSDTTPRVHEIAADLRNRIDAGEFVAGSKLPSTRILSEHYEISPQAIARVIALLKADGIVEGRQGAGVFVRSWQPLVYRPQGEFRRRPPTVDVFMSLLQAEGRDGEQIIEVDTEIPDEEVRRRLQLDPKVPVAVRRRTSYVDGQAFATDDSYVPLSIVEGTEWMFNGSVERGTNAVLAELGYELVEALDEIYIRAPKVAEVERLSLPAGTPVADLITTGHTATGRPIQVTSCILPGDRHVIVYERKKYPLDDAEGHTEGGAE